MKSLQQKIVSIALSLLVMGATTSWTFSTHYCGSIKVDTALFGTPESCGMDMTALEDSAVSSQTESTEKPSCCNELEELVVGQKVYKQVDSSIQIDFYSQVFTPNVAWELTPVAHSPAKFEYAYAHPPPMGETPIYILYEAFLI